jgi:ABC-type multidrug transport system ATPase subunit
MIHSPDVLVLDEPTTGVDAVSRKEFWEMLDRIRQRNITILVSTAYMDEAGLCDRIGLIQNGRLLALDKPEVIQAEFPKKLLGINADDMYRLMTDLENWEDADTVFLFGQEIHVTPREGISDPEKAVREYLGSQGHKKIHVGRIYPGIEDCFLELMAKDQGTILQKP